MDISNIGGADGPTSIFIASSISPYVIVGIIAACIAVIGIIVSIARKNKGNYGKQK